MAVRFYDEALTNKIKNWIKDDSVKVLKPEETTRLFKMKVDEANDKPLKLPFVALSRKTRISVLNTNKRPLSYDGMKIWAKDSEGHLVAPNRMQKLNAIPMKLDYQLDIYAAHMAEADEYLRNFIFNFVNYPNVTIEIPYNDCKLTHESTIYVEEDVEDNSDIPQRLVPGQFTRYTINLTIDNAYIFSAPIKDNILISKVDIEIKNNDGEVLEKYDILKKEI